MQGPARPQLFCTPSTSLTSSFSVHLPHHCTQPHGCRCDGRAGFTPPLLRVLVPQRASCLASQCFSDTLAVRHSPATPPETCKTPNSLHSSCSFHVPCFMFLPCYLSFSYILCMGRDFCLPPSTAVSPVFKNCA